MLLDRLELYVHFVRACIAVYWSSQLIPIISSDDCSSDDTLDVDRYDYMGYGSEYDGWIEDFSE